MIPPDIFALIATSAQKYDMKNEVCDLGIRELNDVQD
jgi:hypothetical protein